MHTVTGETPESAGLSHRELLLELRSDVKLIGERLDQVVRDQAVAVERRSTMFDKAARIDRELSEHDLRLIEMERYVNRERGAVGLARWAVGASGVALLLVLIQLASWIGHAANPAIPQVP